MNEILKVQNLVTSFATEGGRVAVVNGVSFSLHKNQILGIVGESGSGKSVTCLSILGLLPIPAATIDSGKVLFDGIDLLKAPLKTRYHVRGNRIAMIFQEPMTALNPVQKVGRQLIEVYNLHFPEMDKAAVYRRALELFRQVGIQSPAQRFHEYPHQLSGGMRQRVMIAMALACEPDILIADEPTTALDVTIQAQILDLMLNLQRKHGMAIVFITHDLGVIAELCDDVAVMYEGQIVEQAPVDILFQTPYHPYTKGLISSIPRLGQERKSRLLTIEGLVPTREEKGHGCRFANRCPLVQEHCVQEMPELEELGENRSIRCFKWRDSL